MLKKLELSCNSSCLNRATSDEPLFVLRANDPQAPMTIRHWATMSEGQHEPHKIKEARQCADEMEEFYRKKFPTVIASEPDK